MSSFNRKITLVGNKDIAIRPAGQPIDLCPSGKCPGGGCKYNAIDGEILIFNTETRQTIDVAAIATVQKVAIAQAIGSNGCVNDLKYLFHPNFNLCEHQFGVNVKSPQCGQMQILDVWFPNCTHTDTTMGFGIELDDSYVRSTNGHNQRLMYNWVVDNYKSGCTDCNSTAVCDELICQLVDKINGTFQPDPTKIAHHGMHPNICEKYQPFRAARLYPGTNTSKTFCLTVSPTTGCETCVQIPAITGIDLNGTIVNFSLTTDPSDPTRTMTGQIDRVIELINNALNANGGGTAYKIHGVDKCCDYSIQINTCIPTVNLLGAGGAPIAPCLQENVSMTDTATVLCKNCTPPPAGTALTCGIRLFVDPIEVPCNCAWPDHFPPPNMYTRRITPMLLGDDYDRQYLVVNEYQAAERPEGMGYFYQHTARWDSNGGPGGDKMYTNAYSGTYMPLPEAGSRDANISVECEASYCVYDFDINYSALGKNSNGLRYHNRDHGRVLIKRSNAALRLSWEAILAAFAARGLCTTINTTCS